MLRYILVLLFGGIAISGKSQQIVAAEYFINTDPGVGLGAPITVIPDAELILNYTLPSNTLEPGYYKFCFRTKGSTGLWSQTVSRLFYVQTAGVGNQNEYSEITAAEYFINTDPGVGNGTTLPLTETGSESSIITSVLNKQTPGFYNFCVRTKATSGLWSQTVSRLFYVKPAGAGNQNEYFEISAAEYFWNDDPGLGNGIPIPITQGSIVTLEESLSAEGLSLGDYTFTLRFKSTAGIWSATETRKIRICETYGPLAEFSFIRNGETIYFTNESAHEDSLTWKFHDGSISNSSYPIKNYTPGVYPVSLQAINGCGENIKTDTIIMTGISSVFPTIGSNIGQTTVFIYGAGFTSETTCWLSSVSGATIYPKLTVIDSIGHTIKAIFNLVGQNTGTHTVNVSIPGDDDYIVENGFEISDEIGGNLSHTFVGPSLVRPAWWRNYSLLVSNNSNIDARSVQFVMAFPAYSDVIPQFEAVYQDSSGQIVVTSPEFTVIDTLDGEYYGMKVYFGILPYISSHSTTEIKASVRMNQLGSFKAFGRIFNPIDSPIEVHSKKGENNSMSQYLLTSGGGCKDTEFAIKLATIAAQAVADQIFGNGINCLFGIAEVVSNVIEVAAGGLEGNSISGAIQSVDMVKSTTETIIDCALAAGSAIPVGTGIKVAAGLTNAYKAISTTSSVAAVASEYNNSCNQPKINPNNNLQGGVATSWDPNEIHGPDEYEGWLNELVFPYTIFFENADTAQLAAAEVNIYDTLDVELFDLNSFQFKSFSFGNHIIELSPGFQTYTTNYSLGDGLIVRINATLNKDNGAVHWNFITLDSLTLSPPEDVFAGFLPPNVLSPQGEGYVSFWVNRKNQLGDGQEIPNTAAIYFDSNPPIITNTWTNKLDLNSPVSSCAVENVISNDTIITIYFNGVDQSTSVAYYNLYYSKDGGPFSLFAGGLSMDSVQVILESGHVYGFYSVAVDQVGNTETKTPTAEAVVSIEMPVGYHDYPIVKESNSIYPNPSNDYVTVTIHSDSDKKITVQIYSVKGDLIKTIHNHQIRKGVNSFQINTLDLDNGLYNILLQDYKKYIFSSKLLIVH